MASTTNSLCVAWLIPRRYDDALQFYDNLFFADICRRPILFKNCTYTTTSLHACLLQLANYVFILSSSFIISLWLTLFLAYATTGAAALFNVLLMLSPDNMFVTGIKTSRGLRAIDYNDERKG